MAIKQANQDKQNQEKQQKLGSRKTKTRPRKKQDQDQKNAKKELTGEFAGELTREFPTPPDSA